MLRTRVGYTGGQAPSPTYRRIGDHTEAVAIDFNPKVISYRELLDRFWSSHNPLRSLGGRQYRHAIWFHSEEQQAAAEESRATVAQSLGTDQAKIATSLEAAGPFTYAEDYHQKYILRRQQDIIEPLEGLFEDYIAFTDSTVAARLNGWFGEGFSGPRADLDRQLSKFGLPQDLEVRIGKLL